VVLRLTVDILSEGLNGAFREFFFPRLCPVEARRLRSNEDGNLNRAEKWYKNKFNLYLEKYNLFNLIIVAF
jgi:hypothetical protein